MDKRRFWQVFVVLLVLDATAFMLVFYPRPSLNAEEWALIEAQRPRFTKTAEESSMELSMCHDCLNFAIFRRAIGGWETVTARLLQLANAPAFLFGLTVFSQLQVHGRGTSRQNSDITTIAVVFGSVLQCAAAAALVSSFRRGAIANHG